MTNAHLLKFRQRQAMGRLQNPWMAPRSGRSRTCVPVRWCLSGRPHRSTCVTADNGDGTWRSPAPSASIRRLNRPPVAQALIRSPWFTHDGFVHRLPTDEWEARPVAEPRQPMRGATREAGACYWRTPGRGPVSYRNDGTTLGGRFPANGFGLLDMIETLGSGPPPSSYPHHRADPPSRTGRCRPDDQPGPFAGGSHLCAPEYRHRVPPGGRKLASRRDFRRDHPYASGSGAWPTQLGSATSA